MAANDSKARAAAALKAIDATIAAMQRDQRYANQFQSPFAVGGAVDPRTIAAGVPSDYAAANLPQFHGAQFAAPLPADVGRELALRAQQIAHRMSGGATPNMAPAGSVPGPMQAGPPVVFTSPEQDKSLESDRNLAAQMKANPAAFPQIARLRAIKAGRDKALAEINQTINQTARLGALDRKARLGVIDPSQVAPLFVASAPPAAGGAPSQAMWAFAPQAALGQSQVDIAAKDIEAQSKAAENLMKQQAAEHTERLTTVKQQHEQVLAQQKAAHDQAARQHEADMKVSQAKIDLMNAEQAGGKGKRDAETALLQAQADAAKAQATNLQTQAEAQKPIVAAQTAAAMSDPTAGMEPAKATTYLRQQALTKIPKNAFSSVSPTLQNAPQEILNYMRHIYNNDLFKTTALGTDEGDFENHVISELRNVGGLSDTDLRQLAQDFYEGASGAWTSGYWGG